MAIEKVQIGVSTIKDLLDNGYTWLKKDDLGFGSIQERYQASDVQIATIRKHPMLKDLETTAKVFVIIDDTKDAPTATTTSGTTDERGHERNLGSIPGTYTESSVSSRSTSVSKDSDNNAERGNGEVFEKAVREEATAVATADDSFSAFANL